MFEISGSGATVLHAAAEFGSTQLIHYLVEHVEANNRSDLIIQVDVGGNTLVHCAVRNGLMHNYSFLSLIKCVTIVLENYERCDLIWQTDGYGNTPLAILCTSVTREWWIEEGARLLCTKISSVDDVDKYEEDQEWSAPPIVQAARNGHLSTVQFLRHFGADVDLEDGPGHSAVSRAVQNKHYDIADYLSSQGACRSVRHSDGSTTVYTMPGGPPPDVSMPGPVEQPIWDDDHSGTQSDSCSTTSSEKKWIAYGDYEAFGHESAGWKMHLKRCGYCNPCEKVRIYLPAAVPPSMASSMTSSSIGMTLVLHRLNLRRRFWVQKAPTSDSDGSTSNPSDDGANASDQAEFFFDAVEPANNDANDDLSDDPASPDDQREFSFNSDDSADKDSNETLNPQSDKDSNSSAIQDSISDSGSSLETHHPAILLQPKQQQQFQPNLPMVQECNEHRPQFTFDDATTASSAETGMTAICWRITRREQVLRQVATDSEGSKREFSVKESSTSKLSRENVNDDS